MRAFYRHLYHLILRLHPAPFRSEFAHEMALDFENSLSTFGLARLLLDATRSLARQWSAHVCAPQREHAPIPSHPLLAGQYMMLGGEPLTPFELARGSVLFVLLLFALGLAANARTNHTIINNLPSTSAMYSGDLGYTANAPPQPVAGGPRQSAMSGSTPAYAGAGLHTSPYAHAANGEADAQGLARDARISPTAGLSWRDFLLQCAIVSAIVWLTSFLVRRSRSVGMRVALVALGFIGVAAAMAFVPLRLSPTHAQVLQTNGPLPSFEVATIKPRDPKVGLLMTPPGSEDVVREVGTAKRLVAMAFNVPLARVSGGPDWIDDRGTTYVVEGKIPQDLYARMERMTGDDRQKQASLMMQSLLADRFKLKVHLEPRSMPVYELTVAKDGPKLPPPNDSRPPATAPGSNGTPQSPDMSGSEAVTGTGVRIRNMTLDGMLAAPLFGLGDRQIVNKTGLTGKYNLTLNWLPDMPAQRGPRSEIAAPEGQPSIFTALQEQLGLRLVPATAPLDVVVIDSIEHPSEN